MPDFDIFDWLIILLAIGFCLRFFKHVALLVFVVVIISILYFNAGSSPESLTVVLSVVIGIIIALATAFYYVKGLRTVRSFLYSMMQKYDTKK